MIPKSSSLSGSDLKRARRSEGLAAREVGQAMGISATRVFAIENSVHCTRTVVARYRRALTLAAQTRRRQWANAASSRVEVDLSRPDGGGTGTRDSANAPGGKARRVLDEEAWYEGRLPAR